MNKREELAKGAKISALKRLFASTERPVVVGTGFVALDIVLSDREGWIPRTWSGGTCANVHSILSFLGWKSYPIAALGEDLAGNSILQDLKKFNVSTRFIRRSADRRTPIVVEKIGSSAKGKPRHRFVWTCPDCGSYFPSYHSIPAGYGRLLSERIPKPSVFFFDRVSRGALLLARASLKRGAVVVFEPSGFGDERLFKEAVDVSHIVKYSRDRISHIGDFIRKSHPLLEIQTFGEKGLRYRWDGRNSSAGWAETEAFAVTGLRDTVGAGDWCTAGLLHVLTRNGLKGLLRSTPGQIESGILLGQALAAVSCKYEGARGIMYSLSKRRIEGAVNDLLGGRLPRHVRGESDLDPKMGRRVAAVCPYCGGLGRKQGTG